jgi:L-amino acid N-acyltransferase YncA
VDATTIGAAHVQAWRETYPGIVPAARLAALDPVERAAVWRSSIAAGRHVMVAEDEAGLAGFALTAEQREPDLLADHAGEMWSIYLLRRAQRRGIGRALMADAARHLLATGIHTMAVWVMAGNVDAVAFYGALGGRALLRRSVQRPTWVLDEIAFGWDRLDPLVGATPP